MSEGWRKCICLMVSSIFVFSKRLEHAYKLKEEILRRKETQITGKK